MRRSKSVRFFDFSGGLNTKSPVTALSLNEALDLQNINILPSGGFEKRRGNGAFNSTAMNGGASVHGLGYFRDNSGNEFLMAISGDKIYKSEMDGTMDDITGAAVITSGNNNIWTHSVMNDLSILVGGDRATDVPLKWNASGNVASLGGTPPVGEFGLQANNRFFIGNTVSNPSRIAWSVLGDPEDWSGSGSGTQDVANDDGDTLVGAALVGIDHMLLFKQNSIHDLVIRNAPFPLFPLFQNVGAVSKRGIVTIGKVTYFVTPEPRMKATDGTTIIDFPDTLDDVWDGLNKSRLQYLHGIYNRRLNQIWWMVSSGSSSTHDLCIVWDIDRKAWLRHTTGYKMNVSVLADDRTAYCAAYDGKIYEQDKSATFNDASETSPGAINAYWRTGWYDMQSMINTKGFPYLDINFSTQSSGTFEFLYGFDFDPDRKTNTINMQQGGALYGTAVYGTDVYGGVSDSSKLVHTKGMGKFVQFLIRNKNESEQFSFNGFEVPMKENAPFAKR